ncbi:MAG: hypothetical protein ABSH20_10540 [Tepidisphaeraceae bacterium]
MKRPLPELGRMEVVDETVAEILRRKTPAERVAMLCECNRTVRSILYGSLESRHPDWSEAQIRREIARRMCDGARGADSIYG